MEIGYLEPRTDQSPAAVTTYMMYSRTPFRCTACQSITPLENLIIRDSNLLCPVCFGNTFTVLKEGE